MPMVPPDILAEIVSAQVLTQLGLIKACVMGIIKGNIVVGLKIGWLPISATMPFGNGEAIEPCI